jgi:hypothetical protein
MSYAEDSKVPVARSRMEIEQLLAKYGATSIGVMLDPGKAQVFFRIDGWSVRFRMPLPRRDEQRFTHRDRWHERAENAAQRLWEQACRSAWRALLLTIKAKLVSVESNVETFEEAFMAHLVADASGATVGDRLLPEIREQQKALPAGIEVKS